VLQVIDVLADRLARRGWVLRTGLSPGADQSFYRGALAGRGVVELYLPWPGFQARALGGAGRPRLVAVLPRPSREAYRLSARFHPRWAALTRAQRALLARDAHEVLGGDLASRVAAVVCWTADGSLDGRGLLVDGTGQTLRIARAYRIPVLNLGRPEHARQLARASR
jgi:hypothetical protein